MNWTDWDKLKVYDEEQFEKDETAKAFATFLHSQLSGRDDYLCFYEEPDYKVRGEMLPTFTILDKQYGVIVIKLFQYTSEMLTQITNEYWEINKSRTPNQFRTFDEYCYVFRNDIFLPSNDIISEVNFTSIACFPYINKASLKYTASPRFLVLFEDYRHVNLFSSNNANEISDNDWNKLISIVQKAHAFSKDNGISFEPPAKDLSEAVVINNQRIIKLDETQLDASWSYTQESERIRGLAGTGKTVILAIKAARLHRKYPNKKIAYVFFTQALYNHVNSLLNRYYYKITGEYPDPENLQVLHAWGGRTTGPGFYYNVCNNNNIVPITLRQVRNAENPFGEACKRLLDKELEKEYEHILIDEAQDFPVEFFKLVEKVAKKPAKIIVAYDELQTTNDTRMPNFEELFGVDKKGQPKVNLAPKYDYILKKSYRNNIKVLMTAFAFGFGLYSTKGVTQIIKEAETWDALGFEVANLKYGEPCKILRRPENSPNNIQEYYQGIDVLNLKSLETQQEELEWVCSQIANFVLEQNVQPEDIMVIDIDMKNSKDRLTTLQIMLESTGIQSNVPGIVDGARRFIESGFITLTTPRRAKGNEVSVVFVIGTNAIYRETTPLKRRISRNMLFVSITRSKGWVIITGSGDNVDNLTEEFNKIYPDISKTIPEFNFPFPTKEICEQLSSIDLILRDQKKEKILQDKIQQLSEIIESKDVDLLDILMEDDLKQKILEFANRIKKEDKHE